MIVIPHPWTPAFAGVTIHSIIRTVVIPAQAGIQSTLCQLRLVERDINNHKLGVEVCFNYDLPIFTVCCDHSAIAGINECLID